MERRAAEGPRAYPLAAPYNRGSMPLASGRHFGPYEILSLLGAGGMGEVYKARDTKLGRDVALKTLPDSVSQDPERLARFRREAQVLAALNHPHIASIYGLEETNSQRFLVLELVEGETLAARIQRGPLPVEEALAIAQQLAEALEAAHEKGIIHRDLKPANIALTADDQVKVLDFGLAKATDTAAALDGITPLNSPTITSPVMPTGLGVILGTAAYMSPEQARGRAADKRSDVWAFGSVLFEMLTGKRAFEGDEVSHTLATILKSEPAWSALPPSLPPAVESLLHGCLEKNHRERISDISAARFVLKRLSSTPTAGRTPARLTQPPIKWVLLGVASGAAIAATAVGLWLRPTQRSLPVTRFALAVPEGRPLTLSRRAVTVSPDGTRIAYVADGRLRASLWSFRCEPIRRSGSALRSAFPAGSDSLLLRTHARTTFCRTAGSSRSTRPTRLASRLRNNYKSC
jgi:eukaryotic-like serine/threonine-protein kinase